jgi:hypothetical protein
VQKAQNGTARAKPDIQTEIVFKLPAKTCMKSVSATAQRQPPLATLAPCWAVSSSVPRPRKTPEIYGCLHEKEPIFCIDL